MNSDEEDFFSSLKKKKRKTSEKSGEVLSSEDEALCEQQTPGTSCAKRSTVSLDSCFGVYAFECMLCIRLYMLMHIIRYHTNFDT